MCCKKLNKTKDNYLFQNSNSAERRWWCAGVYVTAREFKVLATVCGQNVTISGLISIPNTRSCLCRMQFLIQFSVPGFSYLCVTQHSQICHCAASNWPAVANSPSRPCLCRLCFYFRYIGWEIRQSNVCHTPFTRNQSFLKLDFSQEHMHRPPTPWNCDNNSYPLTTLSPFHFIPQVVLSIPHFSQGHTKMIKPQQTLS